MNIFLRRTLIGATFAVFASLPLVYSAPANAGPFDGIYDEDTSFNEKPAGTQFHQTLFTEYQKLSDSRNKLFGSDGSDAELFNHKALLASTRTAVQVDPVVTRKLSTQDQGVFVAAAERLYRVFERGARELAPVEVAVAQVSYDCWIEATEDERAEDAQGCKSKFEQSIAAAEAKSPYELGQVKVAAPAPVAPAPAPLPPQEYYLVPFVFDKAVITPEGEQVLAQAIRDVKDIKQLKIALRAHADRSGPNDFNLKLSKRRAEAVLNRMAAAGIAQDRLRIVEAVGESRSLIPTPDGVKEQGNRVVEIDLRQ
ncbi:MAG: ompA family protein [Alphaproteobacteria bacterium]|nr:ompA family protein [Alphaproteobacteria bacterium]